jgi:integrase
MPEDLLRIRESFNPQPSPTLLIYFNIMLLALRLGLRPVEVIGLTRAAVIVHPTQIVIDTFRRKTKGGRPFSERRFISPAPPEASLCPYRELSAYLQWRDGKFPAATLLFPNLRQPLVETPMLPSVVNRAAKSLALRIGRTDLCGHSPRIGSATTLALLGYSDAEIKVHGNWSAGSDTHLRYIHDRRTWQTSLAVSRWFFPPPLPPS